MAEHETDVIQSLTQIPFKSRSDTEKNKILKERRPQPVLKVDEKAETVSNTQRAQFDTSWYSTYKWLAGSVVNNRLYCWPCLLFATNKKKIWTKDGFFDFRILHAVAESHAQSKDHIKSVTQFDEVDPLKSAATGTLHTAKGSEYYSNNYLLLQRIVEVTTFLCIEGDVIHLYESDTSDGSRYKRIVDLVFAQEQLLKEHTKELGSVYTEKFSTLLKDVVETMGHEILQHIKDEMKKSLFFAIQVDNALDVYGVPMHSIIIRYISSQGNLEEHFLGFLNRSDKGEQHFVNRLTSTIDAVLGTNSCKEKMVSISLCGSSVNAKELENVRKRLATKAPSAVLIHSVAHQHKVVFQQGLAVNMEIGGFLTMIQSVIDSFRKTSKGSFFLQHILDNVETSHTMEKHWSLSSKSMAFLLSERKNLINACDEHCIVPRATQCVVLESDMLSKCLMDRTFIFLVMAFQDILKITDEFYREIGVLKNVLDCDKQFVVTLQKLENIKHSSVCRTLLVKSVETIGEKMNPPSEYINNILPHYASLFQEIVNTMIDQLRIRFTDLKKMEFVQLTRQSLFKTYKTQFPESALECLKATYGKYFNTEKLKEELRLFIFGDNRFRFPPPDVVQRLIQFDLHEVVPESYKLFSLVSTFPVTNFRHGTCFERLVNYLERCKDLGVAAIESPLSLMMIEGPLLRKFADDKTWYERVINRFIDERKNHDLEIVP